MEGSSGFHVLTISAFRPFISLIAAYNRGNIRRSNVQYLFCSTVMNIFPTSFPVLGVWHLLDINADFMKLVVALPLIISLVQLELLFVAQILKNRVITATIDRLDECIGQSKRAHGVFQLL